MSLELAPIALFALLAAAGVLAWIVLGMRAPSSSTEPDKVCDNCGSTVLDDWRLCPDCGKFIATAEEGADSPGEDLAAPDPESELSF